MATKKYTYTGPVSNQGLVIKERLYPQPWEWSQTEINKQLKHEPELKKYFTVEQNKE